MSPFTSTATVTAVVVSLHGYNIDNIHNHKNRRAIVRGILYGGCLPLFKVVKVVFVIIINVVNVVHVVFVIDMVPSWQLSSPRPFFPDLFPYATPLLRSQNNINNCVTMHVRTHHPKTKIGLGLIIPISDSIRTDHILKYGN